jgi:hypothetical protein
MYFYHSRFCPRCRASRRHLQDFLAAHPELALTEVEVTRDPLTALRDGIFMIPAARIGTKKVTGFILTPERFNRLL